MRTLRQTLSPCAEVPMPNAKLLSMSQVYQSGSLPTPGVLLEHFKQEGRLNFDVAMRIISECTEVLRAEQTLLRLEGEFVIVGDIHGQFFDLANLFELSGGVADKRYLFLGDYVDRGYFSIEVVLYLWSLKLCFPDRIFLLRGNHECRHLTDFFTFYAECAYKYTDELYDECMTSFDCLPLAALLCDKFLCIHGGLSPDITTIADIEAIDRYRETPQFGPMCDLLWADPAEDYDHPMETGSFFTHNSGRGCSYYFSHAAVSAFLAQNKLLLIIRAHEAQDKGYRMYANSVETRVTPSSPTPSLPGSSVRRARSDYPTLMTVFSAPNYLDVYKNKGAFIDFNGKTVNIKQFAHVEHPFWLPNFIDAFKWSVPFIGEKVTDILVRVAAGDDPDSGGGGGAKALPPLMTVDRRTAIIGKIRAVGRISRMFSVLREESEAVVMLKGLSGGALEPGTLLGGRRGIKEALLSFKGAKKADAANERMPPLERDRRRTRNSVAALPSASAVGGPAGGGIRRSNSSPVAPIRRQSSSPSPRGSGSAAGVPRRSSVSPVGRGSLGGGTTAAGAGRDRKKVQRGSSLPALPRRQGSRP